MHHTVTSGYDASSWHIVLLHEIRLCLAFLVKRSGSDVSVTPFAWLLSEHVWMGHVFGCELLSDMVYRDFSSGRVYVEGWD